MAEILWQLGNWDYDNELRLTVRVRREDIDEEITPGDMLDLVINYLSIKIRRGERTNGTWTKLGGRDKP